MQYRTQPDGPLTTISVHPGCIRVQMDFDVPGAHTKLHSHTFAHWMTCTQGAARIVIDGVQTIVRAGDRYLVAAHQQHGVWPLESGTVLLCDHEHADIHPDKVDGEGIPIEWLHRLTDTAEEVPA